MVRDIPEGGRLCLQQLRLRDHHDTLFYGTDFQLCVQSPRFSDADLEGCLYRRLKTLLGEFDARVHWGKLHFLTREQLLDRYPRADAFIELRRELDPDGLFLNDHLRPLFA